MESSDEEDDMLTIKRKDHEIQDDDGKIIKKRARGDFNIHGTKYF